jgi:Sec-independent protein translocase protein TatA
VARPAAAIVEYHPLVDLPLILIIVLIAALIWRGPKTLPQIGAMLGRGVRQARRQIGASKDGDEDGNRPA